MTSDDYRDCVAIYPRGQTRKAHILYIRLMSAEAALAALRQDHAAYVAPEDKEAVLEAWQRERSGERLQ